MSKKSCSDKNNDVNYEKLPLPPPSEGSCYIYIVIVAVTIISTNSTIPLAIFGIVFGKFLASIGDETTQTSLATGILNTAFCFAGLAANILLNKWSCRNVGLLGGVLCTIACSSLFFVQDLISFIIVFGIIQGFGLGLLIAASLTALNNFFDEKLSFFQSLSQALMISLTMISPSLATLAMDLFGYRGTLLCYWIVIFLNIPSSVALSRINWNSKQVLKQDCAINKAVVHTRNNLVTEKSISSNYPGIDTEKPLLEKRNSLKAVSNSILKEVWQCTDSCIEDKTIEIEKDSLWKSISSSVDFSLLKNPKYLNIALGLSLSYSSDVCFIGIIPVILSDIGFTNSDIALTMSIFFACDLVSRVLLSIFSAIRVPNSRQLVLWGTFLSAIFRIGFVWYRSFLWNTIILAALGFLRCFIQTPLPVVISEEYKNQFATAYSLYMVVCGVVTLGLGPLMGFVKSITNSDVMVCHVLTSCYVICVISWVCEMMLDFKEKRKYVNEKITSVV